MLQAKDVEHGIVMSHAPPDRIPEAIEAAKKLGMRSQHYGWPGMTTTKDEDILVAASERIIHIDPFGREVTVRSTDGGRTWTKPEVIFDSVLDDRDANLCTLHDGTIVQTWFTQGDLTWDIKNVGSEELDWMKDVELEWKAYVSKFSQDTITALSRGWLRRSCDGGHTWEKEVYPTIVGTHAGPTVMADGSLICLGKILQEKGSFMAATQSVDGGKTWSVIGIIPCERKRDPKKVGEPLSPVINENHVVEVEPRHLLGAFRTEPVDGGLIHLSDSMDGGKTWTEARKLSTYGYPPHLIKLETGAILLTFADRRAPQSIRAIVSHDGGKRWDEKRPIMVREMPYISDFGYPVSLEVEPGEILTVYYSVVSPRHRDPGADKSDPKESGILSTRWSLPKASV